jgi:ribosomal protein S27AE
MPRSRKIDLAKVQASLNKTCPKCGAITPDQIKRVDFERMECPKCGEKFVVSEANLGQSLFAS